MLKNVPISFEFFPPNTVAGIKKLGEICESFNAFNPEYFSVTFGAGGVNRTKTFRTVRMLQANGWSVTPHLTCIGMPKEILRHIIKNYQMSGITHLVALRGDLPKTMSDCQSDFQYADELVAFIRQETGDHFYIHVAAYPEFHPESPNVFVGLENFKRKVAAGADSAITQYFFNCDAYVRFLESCVQYGIHIPIVPGIMPISNFEKLWRFSQSCGAEIPSWLSKRLIALQHDPVSLQAYGIEVVTQLCEDLIAAGAPGLHFYTLNQLEPTQAIINNLVHCNIHCCY